MMSRIDLKPNILSVIGIILFTTLLLIVSMKHDAKNLQKGRGVVFWLESFCSGDFDACDTVVENYQSSFASIYSSDSRYYEKVLASLVDCIEYIEVQSITENQSGERIYEIYVEYTPYKRIDSLEVPSISKLKEKFEAEEINNIEFQEELERVYFEVYCNNCFQLENNTTRSQVLILSEKEINGVTRVFNTVSFVDGLLSDSNITGNVSFYEENIKEQISDLIKAN